MLPRQRRRDNRTRQKKRRGVEPFRLRLFAVFALMMMGFGVLSLRLLGVGLLPMAEPSSSLRPMVAEVTPIRGDLLDRHGILMASTLSVKSLFADPHHVLDVQEVVRRLPQVLPDLTPEKIRKKLNKNRRFVWLKRHLTPQEVYAVNALGMPGLGFREEAQRFYPHKMLAAHILGGVNYQDKGFAGVEMGAQALLAQGKDVALTVDMRLQHALHEVLANTLEKTGAKGAWGVTLDAKTADILAMVSLPDYDANAYGQAPREVWLNKNMGGVYEMGSVFKLFTHAMAIEEEGMTLDQKFDCMKPLEVSGFKIHDLYPRNAWLSAREVFMHSSNIGAAQIGEMVGGERQQDYLAKLGFFDQHSVGMGHMTAAPLAPPSHRWGRVQTMSVSYGHGMAVTALQMAAAARTVLVDGFWRQPQILSGGEREAPRPVFSPHTIEKMRTLAQSVVTHGTGRRARVLGYNVGGKTGTSEKNIGGQYLRDKNLASFVGALPLEDPRLVTLIMVDEPLEGRGGGGRVAAPAFGKFSQRAMAVLGVPPVVDVAELPTLQPASKAWQQVEIKPEASRLSYVLDKPTNFR